MSGMVIKQMNKSAGRKPVAAADISMKENGAGVDLRMHVLAVEV